MNAIGQSLRWMVSQQGGETAIVEVVEHEWEFDDMAGSEGVGERGRLPRELIHVAHSLNGAFIDSNLVSHAGLVPVMRLAHDAGLGGLNRPPRRHRDVITRDVC
jgi:hypothetical protein